MQADATTTHAIEKRISQELIVNRIKCLVHYWMSIWDMNTGDAAPLIDVLSPEGFQIVVTTQPDPITTIAGVEAWFGEGPKKIAVDNHHVDSIDITPLSSGRYEVRTHVTCPGVTVTGQEFTVRSQHVWEVVDFGGFLPRIAKLSAKLDAVPA